RINSLFLPNIDKDTIPKVWQMTQDYPGQCYAMMGLHPCSVDEDYKTHLKAVEAELAKEQVYAVGETGLDFYWDNSCTDAQKASFEQHIEWGKQLKLPVIIHCRESYDAIYELLKKHNDSSLFGILHCFTGTLEEAEKMKDLGFYLGLGGILTFKNAGVDQVAKDIPLDSIVLETDSPYLAPVPYRGKRNESSYTVHVAKKLAEIKDIKLEEVSEQTTQNAKTIFKF
ncbi:MAG: hydrolase TatD, partial [Bacteroidetes bacterium SW_10_40_5]